MEFEIVSLYLNEFRKILAANISPDLRSLHPICGLTTHLRQRFYRPPGQHIEYGFVTLPGE